MMGIFLRRLLPAALSVKDKQPAQPDIPDWFSTGSIIQAQPNLCDCLKKEEKHTRDDLLLLSVLLLSHFSKVNGSGFVLEQDIELSPRLTHVASLIWSSSIHSCRNLLHVQHQPMKVSWLLHCNTFYDHNRYLSQHPGFKRRILLTHFIFR